MHVQLDRLGDRLVFESDDVRPSFPAKQRINDRLNLLPNVVEALGLLQHPPFDLRLPDPALGGFSMPETGLQLLGLDLADPHQELSKTLRGQLALRESRLPSVDGD